MHGFWQVNGQQDFPVGCRYFNFMHFNTIQISILPVTDLEDNFSLKASLSFYFHQVGEDGTTVCVEIGFAAVNTEDRFVQHRERDLV